MAFRVQLKRNPYIFQVMIQPHNLYMSFSIYIVMLAVVDTITLLIGKYCLVLSFCGAEYFYELFYSAAIKLLIAYITTFLGHFVTT